MINLQLKNLISSTKSLKSNQVAITKLENSILYSYATVRTYIIHTRDTNSHISFGKFAYDFLLSTIFNLHVSIACENNDAEEQTLSKVSNRSMKLCYFVHETLGMSKCSVKLSKCLLKSSTRFLCVLEAFSMIHFSFCKKYTMFHN